MPPAKFNWRMLRLWVEIGKLRQYISGFVRLAPKVIISREGVRNNSVPFQIEIMVTLLREPRGSRRGRARLKRRTEVASPRDVGDLNPYFRVYYGRCDNIGHRWNSLLTTRVLAIGRPSSDIPIQINPARDSNWISADPPAKHRRIIAIADVIIFRFGIIPVAAINDAVRPVIGLHIIIREPGAIRTRTGASPEILFSVNAAICSLKLLGRLLEYIHCTATPQTVVCRASGRGNELLRWTVDDSSNKSNGQNLIPLNISAGRRQSAIRRHPARLHFARTISPSPALRQSAPPV